MVCVGHSGLYFEKFPRDSSQDQVLGSLASHWHATLGVSSHRLLLIAVSVELVLGIASLLTCPEAITWIKYLKTSRPNLAILVFWVILSPNHGVPYWTHPPGDQ